MAIQVRCDCGKEYSLSDDMAGRKVRCKSCREIIRVPELNDAAMPMPMEVPPSMEMDIPPSEELGFEDDSSVVAKPAAFDLVGSTVPSDEEPLGDTNPEDYSDSEEYDVLDSTEHEQVNCPMCGTECSPSDTVCLACGADILQGKPGLINEILTKVPKKVLIGVGIGLGVLVVVFLGYKIIASGFDDSYVSTGDHLRSVMSDNVGAIEQYKLALTWNPDNLNAYEGGLSCAEAAKKKSTGKFFAVRARKALLRLRRAGDSYDKVQAARIHLTRARIYHSLVNDKGDAIRALDAAEKEEPEDLDVIKALRGHILFDAGEWSNAKPLYEALIKGKSKDPLVSLNLAKILRKSKDKKRAQKLIEAALQTHPAEANVELAQIREEEKKWELARENWKKAVAANGDLYEARLGYAKSLLKADQAAAARPHGERARELQPEKLQSRLTLAEILFRLKDFKPALVECEAALKIDEKDSSAQFFKGAIMVSQGLRARDSKMLREGKKLLLDTVQTRKNPIDLLASAKIVGQIKNQERTALRLVEDALRVDKGFGPAHIYKVELLQKMGQSKSAIRKAIEDAIEFAPKNVSLGRMLAGIYWDDGREAEAIALLRKLSKVRKNDEKLLLDLARRLVRYGSDERENPLEPELRQPVLEEALKLLETRLKNELKSKETGLEDLIQFVKTQLLQLG